MLLLHVLSACTGIGAASVYGILYLRQSNRSQYLTTAHGIALTSLFVVSLTSVYLFQTDPDALATSDSFLSNMTVLTILFGLELLTTLGNNRKLKTVGVVLVMFSWTWICSVALIDLSYSYGHIMTVYALSCLILSYTLLVHYLPSTGNYKSGRIA